MPRSLPERPNLDNLRNQAKELLKALKSGDSEARSRFSLNHPRSSESTRMTLGDAQLVIAREYGFPSWPKLKHHVESLAVEHGDPMQLMKDAIQRDDVARVRRIFERYPALKARVNDPLDHFDSPVILNARSRGMLDALIAVGADLNARSRWWAGSFGLLDSADPDLAAYAIQRGARIDAHSAARLGMMDRLRELIETDRSLVHARGGDGQTPLHFAKTVEIAAYLLDRGANIEARDIDHESTPAQWMTDDRLEVARYLVSRGCQTDLLLAAAVGDVELVRRHLDADQNSIRIRACDEFFPRKNHRAASTIYFWTLGNGASAFQAAAKYGHEDVVQLLMERSPADVKLIAACWLHDRPTVESILAADPELVGRLQEADKQEIAHAARNNDTQAMRLFLLAGFPVDARGQHRATPLHWASWHGNIDMVHALLKQDPPLEDSANDFSGTPIGWAIHGSENGWYRKTGRYPAVIEALSRAGSRPPETAAGTPAVRKVLVAHGIPEHES